MLVMNRLGTPLAILVSISCKVHGVSATGSCELVFCGFGRARNDARCSDRAERLVRLAAVDGYLACRLRQTSNESVVQANPSSPARCSARVWAHTRECR